MPGDITRLDLRLRRRSTAAYTVGFAAYAVLIVVLYPAFKNDAALDDLTSGNQTLSALFGATGSLTSPEGWMNANLYANFVPLFALLMTIGYGATAIAGQDEEGTLGSMLSLPLTRHRALAEKAVAVAMLSLPVPVVTMAADLVGSRFELDLSAAGVVGVSVGATLLALDLGLLALAVGAWSGHRGTSLGVAAGVAAVSYVISSLAPVVGWVHDIRFLSPFYWAVGANQLTDGLGIGSLAALAGTAAVLLAVSAAALDRLDVH